MRPEVGQRRVLRARRAGHWLDHQIHRDAHRTRREDQRWDQHDQEDCHQIHQEALNLDHQQIHQGVFQIRPEDDQDRQSLRVEVQHQGLARVHRVQAVLEE